MFEFLKKIMNKGESPLKNDNNSVHRILKTDIKKNPSDKEDEIIFGCGCFWGAEKCFWKLPGVITTSVGYAGGDKISPTYYEVCSGLTGHSEVRYSEEKKKVINEPVKLEQNYRNFDYESPWEGTKYIKGISEINDKKN